MTTLRMVLDRLIAAGVVVEQAEHGQLRLRALIDSRPITVDNRNLCREHKQVLLDYVRFAEVADRLLLDSSTRIAQAWRDGCDAFYGDPAWDDLELQVHDAYWTMDVERLRLAIKERERYALVTLASHGHGSRKAARD